ncbi:hypothetical protein GW17_00024499 [Ensete ventricosum]|nr:hypothetical protein GW17_00024499 [Ensete ventricosum]
MLQLMVTEGCVSFSTESTIDVGCALGTTDLKTIEKRVSGATELKMAERHVSGTTRLMVTESYTSGTIEMKMAERHVSGMIGLMMAHLGRDWTDDDQEAPASEFDRGVSHSTLAKDLYTLPSEVLIARATKQIMLMALLDRVHDSGRLVTHIGNRASLLEAKLEKLRSEKDPKQLARAKQRVGELEADNAKLKSGLDELSDRLDEADKELNELREGLVESQHQLKEQKADRRKADDELLKLMRENESLKAELLDKSIVDYKQSIGLGWGLRRMGQVSYEYGYRVALGRFQARYPDLEIDSNSFTE